MLAPGRGESCFGMPYCDKFFVVIESAKPDLVVVTSKVLTKGPFKICTDCCVWFTPITCIDRDMPGLMVGPGPDKPLINCKYHKWKIH